MPDLFGIDIQGLIWDNMADGLLDATLHVQTPGVRTPGDPTAGMNPTFADEAAKGFIDVYRERQIDGTIVKTGDRKVLLLGQGLTPPKPADDVTIEGERYHIINVMRDPAAATYECQSRKTV